MSLSGGRDQTFHEPGLFCWISPCPWGSAPSHFPALGSCHPPLLVNYPQNPSLRTSPWHLQLLTEKTLLCGSQKCQPHDLCHCFFLHSLPALHFSSAHLLLCFCQMITGCSISIFVLVLHQHKWPQVLPVPAPYHCLKGDLGLQSHFTAQNCLCSISCLLGAYRILLISLWEQRHAGVYFFFKSQLCSSYLFFFFTLPQYIRKEPSSVSDFNQATSSL